MPVGFIQAYPYMATSLAMLALALICHALAWRQWRAVLTGGLLMAPYGLFSFEFIPEYWNPRLIAWWGIASPEDLLFSYCTGVITCALAFLPLVHRLEFRFETRTALRRFLGLSALGIGCGYFTDWAVPGVDVMGGALLGACLVGVIMLVLRRDLWLIALCGALGFALFYLIVGLASLGLAPHFLGSWAPTREIAGQLWGMPLSEILWAMGTGLVWPLFIAHTGNARLAAKNPDAQPS